MNNSGTSIFDGEKSYECLCNLPIMNISRVMHKKQAALEAEVDVYGPCRVT